MANTAIKSIILIPIVCVSLKSHKTLILYQMWETPTSDTISQLRKEAECYNKWVIYFLWTAPSKWRGVKERILAKGKDKHWEGVRV